jgi:CRP-like cAMP-binding protein
MFDEWPAPEVLCSPVSLDKGAVLAKPGTEVHTLYLIEHGLVGRFVSSENPEVLDGARGVGWLVGAVAALTTGRFEATITTLTVCLVRPIALEVFLYVLARTDVSRWLNSMLAADMHAQVSRSAALARRGSRVLVEVLFAELARTAGKKGDDGSVRILLDLKVVDVARLVGATREHTSRILGDLEAAGILIKSKGWFVAPPRSPLIATTPNR